jgi:membrane protease YdiL (CAAX protease family)
VDAFEPEATRSGLAGVRPAASRLRAWLGDAPACAADAADLRCVEILGLRLPVRASIAVVVVALLLLLDYHRHVDDLITAITGWDAASTADAKRIQGIGRMLLLGGVPLLVVLVGFRDRVSRYGLRMGDWRAGASIGLGIALVMTPVVLVVARIPSFAAYYAPQGAAPGDVFLTSALDVVPAEFFFRGFLLFALLRVVGPIAVLIATLPFAFAHLGKPEVETLSTLGGGLVYGWLDWRTGSVLWSALAHTWILGLVVIAAAGMPTG